MTSYVVGGLIVIMLAYFVVMARRDWKNQEGHETFMPVEDSLPMVPMAELTEHSPDAEVFPGNEAQLRWNHSAGLVIIELDRAEEALEDEDLIEVKACLDRARTVAELGTRLPNDITS